VGPFFPKFPVEKDKPMRPLRFALPLVALATLAAPARAADLTVTLTGIEHTEGAMMVALWSDADDFRDEDRAVAKAKVPAVVGTVSVTFPDLSPGTYALMAYHDEDGDGSLDRFMGMIPTEGYALSNDPDVTGPPAFEDSAFEVGPEGTEVTATVVY
jgi:uncharacterized protein (DUF2141 family)